MNLSYWDYQRYFEKLDACIVGAGFTGLYTALFMKLKNPKYKVLILEKNEFGALASTKNAGFACFGSVSELLDDVANFGEDKTIALALKRYQGLQLMRQTFGDEAIDFQNHGGMELFRDTDAILFDKCAAAIPHLNAQLASIGPEVFAHQAPDAFPFQGVRNVIANRFESQVDTGKLYRTLEQKVLQLGVEIIRGMEVQDFQSLAAEVEVHLSDFSFKTKQLAICNNAWAAKLMPSKNVIPARAQVLITEPILDLQWKGTFHYDAGYYYFRNIDNRILIGGGRNVDAENETTYNMGTSDIIQSSIEALLFNVVHSKKVKIDQRWSGTMAVGENKAPWIERVEEGVYCAVKFGGMGVALSSLAGKELAKLMLD